MEKILILLGVLSFVVSITAIISPTVTPRDAVIASTKLLTDFKYDVEAVTCSDGPRVYQPCNAKVKQLPQLLKIVCSAGPYCELK